MGKRCYPGAARFESLPSRLPPLESGNLRFTIPPPFLKTHERKPPGGRSTTYTDYPEGRAPYALRWPDYYRQRARELGSAVGDFTDQLLAGEFPWSRLVRRRSCCAWPNSTVPLAWARPADGLSISIAGCRNHYGRARSVAVSNVTPPKSQTEV